MGADLVRYARGNVAAREGVLGSTEGATTQTSSPEEHEERLIGPSTAQIQVHQEGEPTGATKPDCTTLEDPKGASRTDTTTMVAEGADLVRYARGNVAAGEGVLGSAEPSITNPRRTHTHGQGQIVHGRGLVANRKDLRVVPTGEIKKGTDRHRGTTGIYLRNDRQRGKRAKA